MLIIAAIWLLRRRQFEVGAREVIVSSGLLFVVGVISMMIGLAIVISHPIWELNWRGLITLMGYLLVIQGVLRLGFAQEMRKIAIDVMENGYWVVLGVLIVIGCFLTYNGFLDLPKAGFLGLNLFN
ncbi:MAG: hypothetical protein WCF65_03190 [Parachlamydiaceae bacterium]